MDDNKNSNEFSNQLNTNAADPSFIPEQNNSLSTNDVQKVLTYHYAGFFVRLMAFIIDIFILFIPAFLLGLVFPYVGGLILGIIYKPIFEASKLMATPGKAMLGLRVVKEADGTRLGYKEAFIRYFAAYLSSLILLIGYIMQLFTEKRQTLHDMIAEVVVVKQPAPDINYFSTWLEEIKYFFSAIWNGSDRNSSSNTETSNTNSASNYNSKNSDPSVKVIEELYKLKLSGALTEEEFQAKKAEVLKKI